MKRESKQYVETLKPGDMIDMGDEFGFLKVDRVNEIRTVKEGPNKGLIFRSFEVHTFDTEITDIVMEKPPRPEPPKPPEPRMITEGGSDNFQSLAFIIFGLLLLFFMALVTAA